jgi:hypothetical protein
MEVPLIQETAVGWLLESFEGKPKTKSQKMFFTFPGNNYSKAHVCDMPVSAYVTFADFITLSVAFLTGASGFVNFLAV